MRITVIIVVVISGRCRASEEQNPQPNHHYVFPQPHCLLLLNKDRLYFTLSRLAAQSPYAPPGVPLPGGISCHPLWPGSAAGVVYAPAEGLQMNLLVEFFCDA